jgi:hypothetical protein
MDATPDTTGYMVLGFVAILGLVLAYLGSLRVRWRNLEEDQKALDSVARRGPPSDRT